MNYDTAKEEWPLIDIAGKYEARVVRTRDDGTLEMERRYAAPSKNPRYGRRITSFTLRTMDKTGWRKKP